MKTVSQFMAEDHARLNNLWNEFLLEKKDINRVHELFKNFSFQMEKHIFLEDTELFPRYNDYIGFSDGVGPVEVLSRDHENINKLLEGVRLVILSGDFRQLARESNNLKRLFDKHLQREAQMGYPICDIFISPEKWQEIVIKIYGA